NSFLSSKIFKRETDVSGPVKRFEDHLCFLQSQSELLIALTTRSSPSHNLLSIVLPTEMSACHKSEQSNPVKYLLRLLYHWRLYNIQSCPGKIPTPIHSTASLPIQAANSHFL